MVSQETPVNSIDCQFTQLGVWKIEWTITDISILKER